MGIVYGIHIRLLNNLPFDPPATNTGFLPKYFDDMLINLAHKVKLNIIRKTRQKKNFILCT